MMGIIFLNVILNITGITSLSSSDLVIIVVKLCLSSVSIIFVEGG